jgi:hypothetical protein
MGLFAAEHNMHQTFAACVGALLSLSLPGVAEEIPKRAGTLTYMIPADAPPSFDGHRENTFATIHAMAPFCSVLIRVNPEDPASTTDFVCDEKSRAEARRLLKEAGAEGLTFELLNRNAI